VGGVTVYAVSPSDGKTIWRQRSGELGQNSILVSDGSFIYSGAGIHPHIMGRYRKHYRISERYKAHDEENKYVKGDVVIIKETRPRSKDKRWEIVEKIT